MERYEVNSKLNSPEIEELSIQEQALVSEYQKLSATEYTAERDGEAVTLNDLDLTQESDIALYYAIYEKRNAELGQIYRELVQLRVEIAKKLGYDSYTDYAYDLLSRDFTKRMRPRSAKRSRSTWPPSATRSTTAIQRYCRGTGPHGRYL